jgi:hypothetical protein
LFHARARIPDRVERRKDAHVLAPDRPGGSGSCAAESASPPQSSPEIGFPARTGSRDGQLPDSLGRRLSYETCAYRKCATVSSGTSQF